MNARTKSLFHFTRTLDNLKCILREGFWPQYCLEDFTWLAGVIPRLALPMVSFCDIPLARSQAHAKRYGNYGVGLCRERWKATGLNPILYVSSDSLLRDFLGEVLVSLGKSPNPRLRTGAMVLLGHCKPLEGSVEVEGEKTDFYSECEWRFIPWVERGKGKYGFFLTEDQFHNESIRKAANQERRNDRMLDIVPGEIRHLLVNSDEDARNLTNFIDAEMKNYSREVLNVLKTRILALSHIQADF
jgi:hypothetical protein